MRKIALIVLSTNRPEYLARALASQAQLDLTDCDVDRILIDDFPKDRDAAQIIALAEQYGYRLRLHAENTGIGTSWEEAWAMLDDADFIWQQEDDAVILHPIAIGQLMDAFAGRPTVAQFALKRQAWYRHERPPCARASDRWVAGYRAESDPPAAYYFNPMAGLYPVSRATIDYRGWFAIHYAHEPRFHTARINEALIGKVLLEGYGLQTWHLKTAAGWPLVEHIGAYTVGQKLRPGEPGYEDGWACFDPTVRYDSKTGARWEHEALR